VVDDDPETRTALRAVLEQGGARVRLAESARAALAAFDEARPQVLLCDVAMPGENGYDLIRKIRARGAGRGGDVAAAALTALARVEDGVRATEAGFHLHLTKPIKPRDLIAAVVELAARPGEPDQRKNGTDAKDSSSAS
jgi:CheY-like chemotaxis protein